MAKTRGIRRKNGKLYIVYDVDPALKDGEKKRRQRMEQIPSGRIRDAEARLRQVKREREEGQHSPKAEVPIREVVDSYLRSLPIHLTSRTVKQYRGHCGHIVKELGDVPVKDLAVGDLTRFKAALANGKHNGTQHSFVTVRGIMGRLAAILKHARRERYIFTNPFEEMPSDRSARRKQRARSLQKVDPFSREEVNAFLEWLQKHEPDWYCFFLVWIDGGFRIGEQCALKWESLREAEGRYYSTFPAMATSPEALTRKPEAIEPPITTLPWKSIFPVL